MTDRPRWFPFWLEHALALAFALIALVAIPVALYLIDVHSGPRHHR